MATTHRLISVKKINSTTGRVVLLDIRNTGFPLIETVLTPDFTISEGTPSSFQLYGNRCVFFKGYFYTWFGNVVQRSNGGLWTTVLTTAMPGGENFKQSGLMVMGGFVWGVYGYNSATGGGVRVIRGNGSTWSDTVINGNPTGVANTVGITRWLMFNGHLFFFCDGSNANTLGGQQIDVRSYDGYFIDSSFGGYNGTLHRDFVVWHNRLFMLCARNTGIYLNLWEYVSANWVSRAEITSSGNLVGGGNNPSNTTYIAFVDEGEKLNVLYYSFSNPTEGWYWRRFSMNSGVVTDDGDFTGVILPSYLRPTPATNYREGTRWWVIQDGITGDTLLLLVPVVRDADHRIQLFRFNGGFNELQQLTTNTQGLVFVDEYQYNHTKAGSGNYFYNPMHVEVVSQEPNDMGIKIGFQMYGIAGQHVDVRFKTNLKGHLPRDIGSLVGNTVGTITGGNVLQDVLIDNGASTGFVTVVNQIKGSQMLISPVASA